MKFTNTSNTVQYASLPARISRRSLRSLWTAAPSATPVAADKLSHDAEVMRALTLAVPLSLVLWAPLIWAVAHCF